MSRIAKRMDMLGEVQISGMTQLRPLVFVLFLFLVGFLFRWIPSKFLLLLPLLGTPFVLAVSNHWAVLKKSPPELREILKKYFLFNEFIWLLVSAFALAWFLTGTAWWGIWGMTLFSFFLILGKEQLFYKLVGKTVRVKLKGRFLVVEGIVA